MTPTARPFEAKSFLNKPTAWLAANAYVAAHPTHSVAVERHPRLGGYAVAVWRPNPGCRLWL